jgi:hypothetical protein
MPTIVELANQAGQLARAMSVRAGLNPYSPMFLGLASGFDVAITLIEESTGTRFGGLNSESALKVVKYLRDEAGRCAAMDLQVADFYNSWAEIIESIYISR